MSESSVRVFKVKGFARFQRRERIADSALARVVRNAEDGLVDADLGGGLVKQRIARPGQGKSGGFRTVIGRSSFWGSPRTSGTMSMTKNSTNSKRWREVS